MKNDAQALDRLFESLSRLEEILKNKGLTQDRVDVGLEALSQIRESVLVVDDGPGVIGFYPAYDSIATMVENFSSRVEASDGSEDGGDVADALARLAFDVGWIQEWGENWARSTIEYLKKDKGSLGLHAHFYAPDGVTNHGKISPPTDAAVGAGVTGSGSLAVSPEAENAGVSGRTSVPMDTMPIIASESPPEDLSSMRQAELEVAKVKANERSKRFGISVRQDGYLVKPEAYKDISNDSFADPVNYRYPILSRDTIVASARQFADDAAEKYTHGRGEIMKRLIGAKNLVFAVDSLPHLGDLADESSPRTIETYLPMSADEFASGNPLSQAKAAEYGLVPLESHVKVEYEILEQAGQNGASLPPQTEAKVLWKLTFADIVNSEGQVYTSALWKRQMPRLQSMAQSSKLLGILDHPSDGRSKLSSTCIKWLPDTLQMQGNTLVAEGYILSTSAGKDLMVLIANDIPVESSSRGFGVEYPGKLQGRDVSYIDPDRYVCNGFDIVFCGASADGESRTTIERLAQEAVTPGAADSEEGQIKMEKRVKELEARLVALQEKGLVVDKQIKKLQGLPEDDEAAAGVLDEVEQAAVILEESVTEDEGVEPKEQAYSRTSVDVTNTSGDVVLRIPLDIIKGGQVKNPYGGSTANDDIIENPADYPKGVQVIEATHPVDASTGQANARMIKYKQESSIPPEYLKEMLQSKVERVLRAEKHEKKHDILAKRLQSVESIEDIDKIVQQVNEDYDAYCGSEDEETSSKVQRNDMSGYGHINFQRGVKNPAEVPPKNIPEAIEKLVQKSEGDKKFMPLEQVNPATGGKYQNSDALLAQNLGQDSPEGMLRSHLQHFAQTGRGQAYFRQHILLENAIYNQSKLEFDNIMEAGPLTLMLQALDTGGTGLSEVAAGQAHLLKLISAVFPRLIIPYVGAIQPTSKPTATVYYEKYMGTGDGSTTLTSAADSGTEPLLDFDVLDYRSWATGIYAEDPGEATDASIVQYTITSDTVTITAKKMRAQWSFELEQDLMSYHALDVASQHVSFMADEIAREINDQILDACMASSVSAGNSVTFKTVAPSGIDADKWDPRLIVAFQKASDVIFEKRGGEANIVVAAPNVVLRMQQLNVHGAPTTGFMQPLVEGLQPMERMWDQYSVFKYSRWAKVTAYKNRALLIHRGPRWSSIGVVWVPYTFEVTPLDTTASNFTRELGCMDRSGYKIVNSNCFNDVVLTGDTATEWDVVGGFD